MKAGKTVDEAAAEVQTGFREYKGYSVSIVPQLGVKSNLQLAYDELKKK